jgi:hypothetical protein
VLFLKRHGDAATFQLASTKGWQGIRKHVPTCYSRPVENITPTRELEEAGGGRPVQRPPSLGERRQFADSIVAARESLTVEFGRKSSDLGQAFILGVNMAIAEGHSLLGPEVREVVYQSLSDANVSATALGLELSRLQECIDWAHQSASSSELHTKITAVRVGFGSSLQ